MEYTSHVTTDIEKKRLNVGTDQGFRVTVRVRVRESAADAKNSIILSLLLDGCHRETC